VKHDPERATLIKLPGKEEEEITLENIDFWLRTFQGDAINEAARVVVALCEVIRELR